LVYIRAKKVKSDQYLYLVKSVWDSKKSTSKQEILKYLGKASEVVKDDIPEDYRNDPKILSILASYNPKDIKKREESTKKAKQQLYKRFTEGDIEEAVKISDEYTKLFSASEFFDRILKPVMYKVGEDWATKKISIATEHVASNIAQALVKIIMEQVTSKNTKKKILICVPLGEEHHLGCDVLQTFLSIKGFKVFNIGTSIPTESILSFIEYNKPDVVLISITLEDNIGAGQRLVKKIREQSKIPILVGGYVFQSDITPKFNAKIVADSGLDEIYKIIRKT